MSNKELKTPTEIFEESSYLFICEFSETKGATAWYVYPELRQKFPPGIQHDDDLCVKKRLARQFLSSDHCKQSCDDSLHLAKNAKFYQEIEIAAAAETSAGTAGGPLGEKNNPISLCAVGVFFKVSSNYYTNLLHSY